MGRGFCSITVPLDYFSMPLPAAIWGGQPGKEKARNTGQRKPLGVTQGQSGDLAALAAAAARGALGGQPLFLRLGAEETPVLQLSQDPGVLD